MSSLQRGQLKHQVHKAKLRHSWLRKSQQGSLKLTSTLCICLLPSPSGSQPRSLETFFPESLHKNRLWGHYSLHCFTGFCQKLRKPCPQHQGTPYPFGWSFITSVIFIMPYSFVGCNFHCLQDHIQTPLSAIVILRNSWKAVNWRNVLYRVAGSHVYDLKQEIPSWTFYLMFNGEKQNMII